MMAPSMESILGMCPKFRNKYAARSSEADIAIEKSAASEKRGGADRKRQIQGLGLTATIQGRRLRDGIACLVSSKT
jgi:hypothetical protein